MPEYRLPTWNIYCGIYHPGVPYVAGTSALKTKGQARMRLMTAIGGATGLNVTAAFSALPIDIIVPAGTDIRRVDDTAGPAGSDLRTTRLEILMLPGFIARVYACMAFEDRAIGFANETRVCWCVRVGTDTAPLLGIYPNQLPPPP